MVEDEDENDDYKNSYDPFGRNFIEGGLSEWVFVELELQFLQTGFVVRVLLGDYDG